MYGRLSATLAALTVWALLAGAATSCAHPASSTGPVPAASSTDRPPSFPVVSADTGFPPHEQAGPASTPTPGPPPPSQTPPSQAPPSGVPYDDAPVIDASDVAAIHRFLDGPDGRINVKFDGGSYGSMVKRDGQVTTTFAGGATRAGTVEETRRMVGTPRVASPAPR